MQISRKQNNSEPTAGTVSPRANYPGGLFADLILGDKGNIVNRQARPLGEVYAYILSSAWGQPTKANWEGEVK